MFSRFWGRSKRTWGGRTCPQARGQATAAVTATTATTTASTACQSLSDSSTIALPLTSYLPPASSCKQLTTDPRMKSPVPSSVAHCQGAFVLFTSGFALYRDPSFTSDSPCRGFSIILEFTRRSTPLLCPRILSLVLKRPSLASFACHLGLRSAPTRRCPQVYICEAACVPIFSLFISRSRDAIFATFASFPRYLLTFISSSTYNTIRSTTQTVQSQQASVQTPRPYTSKKFRHAARIQNQGQGQEPQGV